MKSVRSNFLSFSPPSIGEEEIAEVVATLRSDWISTGPRVARFEKEFAAFVEAPAGLAVNSGTSALHVALATLGIGAGDVVVTTPMTFCSTVHVIEHVGATPFLVDVELDTLNIDLRLAEATIAGASRTSGRGTVKALLPVHLYGHPCDLRQLQSLASAYQLHLIEDAAHALPAKYNGRPIGSVHTSPASDVTNFVAFSFYATKNMTTSEGGMLVGPPELLEEARIWSNHGMSREAYRRYSSDGSWRYDVLVPGFKYNMTDIQAALGTQQLKKLTEFHSRRQQIVAQYNGAFEAVEELEVPPARSEVDHAWHLYAIRLNLEMLKVDRATFIEELKARNIGASVHFIPVHLHSYYQRRYGYQPTDFPVASREYWRLVSLPLNPRMTDCDVDDVVEAVVAIIRRHRR